MRNQIVRYILNHQILTGLLFILFGWFIYEIREILVDIFISFIIMAALIPAVTFLRKRKVPKVVAVVVSYVSVIIILVVIVFPLVPFFVSQLQSLFKSFPIFFDQAANLLGLTINTEQINAYVSSEFNSIGRNAVVVTGRVLGGVFSIITILVVSFYLLLERDNIIASIVKLFPKKSQEEVSNTIYKVEFKLGAWIRGQLVLSLFIGSITWIALTVLGVPFALPLALLAGILEIIPTIGPIIASIPAIIVAVTISPTLAFIVAGAYLIIQILENNILVPKIMEKAVGLNPLIIIIGVMIGAKLLGVIGALLSVPFIALLVIFIETFKAGLSNNRTN